LPVPILIADNGPAGMKSRSRILIVDDEQDVCALLIHYIDGLGYECFETGNSKEALTQVQNNQMDLIITDLSMPGMDGIELLREIKRCDDNLPVVMITGNNDPISIIDAMKTGADDYILKPFTLQEISRGISGSLKRSAIRKQIQAFQNNLERMLLERTSQVQHLFLSIVQSLIVALEQKDAYTNGHSQRVAWLSVSLAEAAGITRRDIDILHVAAVFHDLGKIGIHESILTKTSPLTKEEYSHIKTHCDLGVRILAPLQEFKEILPLVRHHHERYDGRGYPMNLRREEIPFGARILSIADAFDAMISGRSYRSSLSIDKAISRLRRASGSQFDPDLVRRFISFAESDKFRETIHSPLWTLHEGCVDQGSIPFADFPLDVFNSFAQIPISKSVSPEYQI
jgi:putative two-component system response regulator